MRHPESTGTAGCMRLIRRKAHGCCRAVRLRLRHRAMVLTWLVAAFGAAGADLASAAAAASSSEYSSSLSVGGIMPAVAGCPAARLRHNRWSAQSLVPSVSQGQGARCQCSGNSPEQQQVALALAQVSTASSFIAVAEQYATCVRCAKCFRMPAQPLHEKLQDHRVTVTWRVALSTSSIVRDTIHRI